MVAIFLFAVLVYVALVATIVVQRKRHKGRRDENREMRENVARLLTQRQELEERLRHDLQLNEPYFSPELANVRRSADRLASTHIAENAEMASRLAHLQSNVNALLDENEQLRDQLAETQRLAGLRSRVKELEDALDGESGQKNSLDDIIL